MTSLLTLIADSKRHDDELKELREQVKELSLQIEGMAQNAHRNRDQESLPEMPEHHRRLLSLIDATLLNYERNRVQASGSKDKR